MKLRIIIIFVITVLTFTSCNDKPKVPIKTNKNVLSDSARKSNHQNIKSNTEKQLTKFYIRNEKHEKIYGFKNSNGDIVIQAQFKYADNFKNHLAKVSYGKYWGIINTKGIYVVEPKYDYVSYLENNFSLINKDRLWGYLDRNFKLIINPKFSAASPFKNNKAMVFVNNDTLAQIDTLGNIKELFFQFPDTVNNKLKSLPSDQINKILKPSESYGNLQDYIKNHLELDNYDIYFLRKGHPNEEGYTIGFEKLKYGIIFIGYYSGEYDKKYLRIPGITFDDGVNLAIQIVGYNLESFNKVTIKPS